MPPTETMPFKSFWPLSEYRKRAYKKAELINILTCRYVLTTWCIVFCSLCVLCRVRIESLLVERCSRSYGLSRLLKYARVCPRRLELHVDRFCMFRNVLATVRTVWQLSGENGRMNSSCGSVHRENSRRRTKPRTACF